MKLILDIKFKLKFSYYLKKLHDVKQNFARFAGTGSHR